MQVLPANVNMEIARKSYVVSTLSARTTHLPPTQHTPGHGVGPHTHTLRNRESGALPLCSCHVLPKCSEKRREL